MEFKSIFQPHIRPPRSIMIIMIVITTIKALNKSKPRRRKVTINIARKERAKLVIVSLHVVRYCS